MFRTTLHVAHVDQKDWRLTKPLVWEGEWEFFIIRSDFRTDFASIPKPVRWLLDNAGRNAEAAVLHDAVWRESQRKVGSRVDPWHADGVFRRALRQTGAPALTRSLMWFAVRATATFAGRFGKLGPSLPAKILQLLAIFVLGVVAALPATIIAAVGLVLYWLFSWIVAVVWSPVERARGTETNWPWPAGPSSDIESVVSRELLVIVDKEVIPDALRELIDGGEVDDEDLDRLLPSNDEVEAARQLI
ncbi:MAG: DUF1353 domain-containing protein [Ilumatobacter sp.]|uniref:DUF1353 domain-containing protein n=1 Tax=Ilumatobacter sp. TaxID=1967498 RepID=UPI003C757792